MEFDITNTDKAVLIKALFAFSAPLRMGAVEYLVRKNRGENVDDLTDKECDEILWKFKNTNESLQILDYYKGKPMKLFFIQKKNGRILVDSTYYDSLNGEYRFLEAMLNYFPINEILITKKGYRRDIREELPKHLSRTKDQISTFVCLIKDSIQKENEFGKYWELFS
jgi:hypothetical protein